MTKIKQYLQNFLQKIFRKKRYEFKQALKEFSKSLTLIIDFDQLKDNVIAKIREIIRVDSIVIFLLNQDLNRFQITESRGLDNNSSQFYFNADDPLIRWFTTNETHLVVSKSQEIFSFFDEYKQNVIKQIKTEFIFPLLAMNRVTGLVCLSTKTTGEDFSAEDIELLNTLLGQAALAFENAYLYQQQKSRFKRMYRADRLATLGQLAAGAAHEIRNPLTSIRSTVQYLEKQFKDTSHKELVGGLLDEVDRINGIIEGLLSFSKPIKPQMDQVDIKQLLEQTLQLIKTSATKHNIEINLKYNTKQKIIKADQSQLKQVFLNIIMNSLQAMKNGGNLNIDVSYKKQIHQSQAALNIQFQDTGTGIPAENLEHIFDPFFTTKNDGI